MNLKTEIYVAKIVALTITFLIFGCTTTGNFYRGMDPDKKLKDFDNSDNSIEVLDNAESLSKKDKSTNSSKSASDKISQQSSQDKTKSQLKGNEQLESFFEDDVGQFIKSGPSIKQIDDLYDSLSRYAHNVAATGRAYQANLNKKDEIILEFLLDQDPSSRTSKERAVLFIALLEHGVVEYDHLIRNPEQGSAEEIPQILIKLAGDYGIRIYDEIKRNSYLDSPAVYHMSVVILKHVDVADSLSLPIFNFIKDRAKQWYSLYETINLLVSESDTDGNIASDSDEDIDESFEQGISEALGTNAASSYQSQTNDVNQNQQAQFSVGQSQEDESLIAEAKVLYDKKMFAESLEILNSITSSSLLYPTAQDLIKKYSDDAVNDLRRLAAGSYQNYLRVNSRNKKLDYLIKAENNLLTALSTYPDSKWIAKVKNNLAIIQQRKEQLEKPDSDQYEDN